MEKETLYANTFNIFSNMKYDEVCLTFSQVIPFFKDFDFSKPVERATGASMTVFLNSTLALELANEIAKAQGMQIVSKESQNNK